MFLENPYMPGHLARARASLGAGRPPELYPRDSQATFTTSFTQNR